MGSSIVPKLLLFLKQRHLFFLRYLLDLLEFLGFIFWDSFVGGLLSPRPNYKSAEVNMVITVWKDRVFTGRVSHNRNCTRLNKTEKNMRKDYFSWGIFSWPYPRQAIPITGKLADVSVVSHNIWWFSDFDFLWYFFIPLYEIMKIKNFPPRRILPLFLTRAVLYMGGQTRYRTDNSNDYCQMDSLGICNFRHVLPIYWEPERSRG